MFWIENQGGGWSVLLLLAGELLLVTIRITVLGGGRI